MGPDLVFHSDADSDPESQNDPQYWVHTEKCIFLAKQTEPRHRLHRPLRQSHIQRYKLRVILKVHEYSVGTYYLQSYTNTKVARDVTT